MTHGLVGKRVIGPLDCSCWTMVYRRVLSSFGRWEGEGGTKSVAVGRGCHSAFAAVSRESWDILACFIMNNSIKHCLDWSHLNVFLALYIVPSIVFYRLGILEDTNSSTRLLSPDTRVHNYQNIMSCDSQSWRASYQVHRAVLQCVFVWYVRWCMTEKQRLVILASE